MILKCPTPPCLVDARAVSYPASVVDDAEVRLVLQLPGLLELAVGALFLEDLVHEGLVCSFGEPALLVQQGQDARGVVLPRATTRGKQEVKKEVDESLTKEINKIS